jgi:hypothetical protein
MQTRKIAKRPSSLVQGHLFNLKNLKFSDGQDTYTFESFYPEVEIKEVKKGLVVTQTCDLEHRKSPYLTIGLLEPFSKNPLALLENDEEFLKSVFLVREDVQSAFFCFDSYKKKLEKDLGSFIQNRSQYYLFLSIQAGATTSYFYVNLTKLFPIRCSNYEEILKNVTHQVKGDFQHLIGWKMANLYGRVGVTDYAPSGLQTIISKLAPKIQKQIKKELKAEMFDVRSTEVMGKLRKMFSSLDAAGTAEKRRQIEGQIATLLDEIRSSQS